MKTFRINSVIFVLVATIVFLQSCKPKKETEEPIAALEAKVYVLNEGSFGSGNSSVSIFDPLYNKMYNDLFSTTNGRPMGDVLQSMCLVNDKAYWVVNNSNKIEITDTYPLTSKGVINGLVSPRYIIAADNNKAYLSEWSGSGVGRVSVIDLNSNSVSSSIPTGDSPESMILANNKLYVCISNDTTVAVINTSSNTIEQLIKVPGAPTKIISDNNGMIWVYCFGTVYNPDYSKNTSKTTNAALVKIDPSSNQVVTNLSLGAETYDGRICTNKTKDELYYYFSNGIYNMSSTATSLPSSALLNRKAYGLGIEPLTGTVYVGSYGFSSNQYMVRYTNAGTLIDSTEVGVGPSTFVFVE